MTGDRIEALIGEIRSTADEPTLGRVEELVAQLVDLYGSGLSRVVALLHETGAFTGALRAGLTGDPLVSALLMLHGLHPDDTTTRVQGALDRVRPYLAPHAGDVSLLDVEAGVVRVRLEGSCDGCTASAATALDLLDRAIKEAAPEVTRVELASAPRAASDLVQLRRAPSR